MPIVEYKCECNLVTERILPSVAAAPETTECPRCKQMATKREFPSSIALSRSGMDNAPLDNGIGKDAEVRWEAIHARQAKANKVRAESGSAGVSMVGRDTFIPVTETQKELRTSLSEAVVASGGFKNSEHVPGLK